MSAFTSPRAPGSPLHPTSGAVTYHACPISGGDFVAPADAEALLNDVLGAPFETFAPGTQGVRPAPNCPSCDATMEPKTFRGVAVARCPSCTALWFDAGALHTLTDGALGTADIAQSSAPAPVNPYDLPVTPGAPGPSPHLGASPNSPEDDLSALTDGIPTGGGIGGQIGMLHADAGSARMRGGPVSGPTGFEASATERYREQDAADHAALDAQQTPASTALTRTRGDAWLDSQPMGLVTGLELLLGQERLLKIEQIKEMAEILVGWERENAYYVTDAYNNALGHVLERNSGVGGIARRMFLGAKRPFHGEVIDKYGKQVLIDLNRPFAFFFSELSLSTPTGRHLGSVRRRFSVLYKKYDLFDDRDVHFATIKSPLWRIWHFPITDPDNGRELGHIAKKWSGFFKEAFSDADTFEIDFNHHGWTLAQRAVILCAAVLIDFDFFENNHQR